MITQFRVQNYKALRDVTLNLTPIHVLIGPNDSGKTSILEAISALCRSVDHEVTHAFVGSWTGNALVWGADPKRTVVLTAAATHDQVRFKYTLDSQFMPNGKVATVWREASGFANGSNPLRHETSNRPRSLVCGVCVHGERTEKDAVTAARNVHDAIGGVQYYRWVPRLLALPVAPDSKVQYRMEPSGFGLARCLDDILGYDREQFAKLETRFRKIFPHIKSIMLKPEPAFLSPTDDPTQIPMLSKRDGKGIHFKLVDSEHELAAAQISDGVMLVLAYLAILHLPRPPRVLLVEEPENGIHPGLLKVVLEILRDLIKEQSKTQVILTTHSPYVVDLFKPEEVTLCHKEDDGSVSVRRLSESKKVREQLDVFTLGEIWTGEGDEALAKPDGAEQDSTE